MRDLLNDAKKLDPKHAHLGELGLLFSKAVAGSHARVQEKALDALILYLKAADADAGSYAKEICDSIVANCLTGRAKTVKKARRAFMLWIELGAVEAFLDAMEKAITSKTDKVVVSAIDIMIQALSEFQSNIIPPEIILKMLLQLLDHQSRNVLASAKRLTLELCSCIGKDKVQSILFENMHDRMEKELKAKLDSVARSTKTTCKVCKVRSKQQNKSMQMIMHSINSLSLRLSVVEHGLSNAEHVFAEMRASPACAPPDAPPPPPSQVQHEHSSSDNEEEFCCSCCKKSTCKTSKCECRDAGALCTSLCSCMPSKCNNRRALKVNRLRLAAQHLRVG